MKYGEPAKAPYELVYGKAIEPFKVIDWKFTQENTNNG
tara:strand:+ start:665 stop:778 length:114 start_codon:yes stop_codon:yes gene_type:complete